MCIVRDRNQGLQIVNDWSQGFDFKSINDENMHAIQIAENAFDVSIIVRYESIGRQIYGIRRSRRY